MVESDKVYKEGLEGKKAEVRMLKEEINKG